MRRWFLGLMLLVLPCLVVNAQERSLVLLKLLNGHEYPVSGISASPDGRWLVSWSGSEAEPGEFYLWDATTGEKVLDLNESVLHGTEDWQGDSVADPAFIDVAQFSPDSGWLAVLTIPSGARLWNLHTLSAWRLFGSGCMCTDFWSRQSVTFSPDSKLLASLDTQGDMLLLDLSTDNAVLIDSSGYQVRENEPTPIARVAFSPDSRLLGVIQQDFERGGAGILKDVKLWDLQTGENIMDYESDDGYSGDWIFFSADGRRLVAASGAQAMVFALDTLDKIADPVMVEIGWTQDIRLSPDGSQFAALMLQKTPESIVSVWDMDDGQLRSEFKDEAITAFTSAQYAFLPDGRPIYAVQHDGTTTIAAFDPDWQPDMSLGANVGMATNAANATIALYDGQHLALFDASGSTAPLTTLADPALGAQFFAEGEGLATYSGKLIAIYGHETADSPALPYALVWGEVKTRAISVRVAPGAETQIIAHVLKGAVLVGGVDASGEYAYLPEFQGWVRIGSDYLQVDTSELPVLPE